MNEKYGNRESGLSASYSGEQEKKDALERYFVEAFSGKTDQSMRKVLESIEEPITPEVSSLFEEINNYMALFVKYYGGRPVTLSNHNLLIINEEKLPKSIKEQIPTAAAICACVTQEIIVINRDYNRQQTPHLLARILVHEMLHFNSFVAARLKTGPNASGIMVEEIQHIRQGLTIGHPEKRKATFDKLSEAVTEELAIRFGQRYFSQFKNEDTKERSKQENTTVDREYVEERAWLHDIINKIKSHPVNTGKFNSEEQIFEIFANAYFSGDLKPLVQLIDGTFGSGSFKNLGEDSSVSAFT